MRIAVTGASGFVGGVVARWLLARGHEVWPFGRRGAAALPSPLPRYAAWDVTAGAITPPAVDAVVHCAARVGQWGADTDYHDVNVRGTAHVVESFRSVRRLVHVSSASVYSSGTPARRLREDAPADGACIAYGRTKAAGERVVRASGIDAVVLRPHVVYGPGDTTLWPRVAAARRLGWLPVPGDGTNRISVTHVENLARAVEAALAPDAPAGTYNVTDGDDPTVDQLLRTMLRRHALAPRIAYIPRALAWPAAALGERAARLAGLRREPTLTRYVVSRLADECTLDITAARSRLGYVPRWSHRDGPLD